MYFCIFTCNYSMEDNSSDRTLFRQDAAIESVVRSTVDRLLAATESIIASEEDDVKEVAAPDGSLAKRPKARIIGGGRRGAAHRRQYSAVLKMEVIGEYEACTSLGVESGEAAAAVALRYKIDRSLVIMILLKLGRDRTWISSKKEDF